MIVPFKGIVYNPDNLESFAEIISPPYDVIQPEMQNALFERSPFNFCRLDLPKETGDERYNIAGDLFQKWMSEEILTQDRRPTIYLHRHTFRLPDGNQIQRVGFFAACQLADFSEGKVLPHEKTLDGPKQDRLNMTRATETNLSPVFSLYSDEALTTNEIYADTLKTTPFMDFMSDDQERHELWKMQDEAQLKSLQHALEDKRYFIADGHHRYETALNYRKEARENNSELSNMAAPNFLLMYFCNLNDPGLVVLPIHRAVHSLEGFDVQNLLGQLSQNFEVQSFPKSELSAWQERQKGLKDSQHAFLMLPQGSEEGYLVSIGHDKWQSLAVEKGIEASLAELDVTVLHQEIFGNLLGMTEADQASQKNIIYYKSEEKALQEIASGNCQVTFLLNSTKIEQMQNVATAGLKMPQKSTFFFPKIVSGLVIHSVKALDHDGIE